MALTVHLGSLCLLLIRDHCSTLIYRQETILSKSRTEKIKATDLQTRITHAPRVSEYHSANIPGATGSGGALTGVDWEVSLVSWEQHLPPPWHSRGAVCGFCLWAWLLAMFVAAWLFSLPFLTSKKEEVYPGVFTEPVVILQHRALPLWFPLPHLYGRLICNLTFSHPLSCPISLPWSHLNWLLRVQNNEFT